MSGRPSKRQRLDVECDLQVPSNGQNGHGFGSVSVDGPGQTNIHQGDNTGVHHHHYGNDVEGIGQKEEDILTDLLIASLLFERMDERMNTVKPALQKTCTWLAKHEHYKTWISEDWDSHNGFLWIKGKPGSGKSTIMKHTLREVQRLQKSWLITSYFFNARASGALEKSSTGFYRSVVHSLLSANRAFRKLFYSTFRRKVRGEMVDDWTKEELQNWLDDLFKLPETESTPICIFIDALDEGDVKDIQDLISSLDDLASCAVANGHKLRICLSSRHYPSVVFERGLSLDVEDQPDHDADIALYIQKKLIGASSAEMLDLCENIHRRSEHVFLWVVLVVTILNEDNAAGSNLDIMNARLREIPSDLDGLFQQILTRPGQSIIDCMRLLRWVRFAFRPLRAEELYMAIRCRHAQSNSQQSFHQVPNSERLERFLLNASRGLVELTKSRQPTVQFIHETVRTYVLASTDLGVPNAAQSLGVDAIAHEEISEDCWLYVSLCGFVPGYRQKNDTQASFSAKMAHDFPLLGYALEYTYKHADKAAEYGSLPFDFLKSRSNCLGSWQDHHFRKWRDEVQKFEVRKYGEGPLPLIYMLVDNDLANLVRVAIDLGHDVNRSGGRYGSPLAAACVAGNLQTVEFLLKNKARHDYNCAAPTLSPWALAVSSKNLHIARAIHKRGYRIEPDVLRSTLLQHVARNSVQGIEAALEGGADPDTTNDKGQSAMVMAISKNNMDAFEALARNGARSFRGTLNEAMLRGGTAIVNKVLNLAPLPHTDLHPDTLKSNSISQNEILVMGLLKAAKADVRRIANGQDSTNIQLLKKAGFDMDICGNFRLTAAWEAAAQRDCESLDLLLKHGARINSIWRPIEVFHFEKHTQTNAHPSELRHNFIESLEPEILIEALERQCITCVTGFMKSANLSEWSRADCEYVLRQAVTSGSYECTQAVLAAERLSAGIKTQQIHSSIQTAVEEGYMNITKLLLDHGASVNELCHQARTDPDLPCSLLSVAVDKRNRIMMRLLLERGADVFGKDGRGCQSPLVYAVTWKGFEEVRVITDHITRLVRIDSFQYSEIDRAVGQALYRPDSAEKEEILDLLHRAQDTVRPLFNMRSPTNEEPLGSNPYITRCIR